MAYTYEDFTTAAKNAGLMDSFDQNDLDYAKKYPEFGLSMVSLKRDLGSAQTDEQKLLATEAMNQLRKNYGSYWTGNAGNRSYATSYGSKITGLQDQIDNYGPFSYDPSTDPLYADYKKAYLREGQRAAANALGQAAASTGGIPSSYATQAAQQAANYYAGKVADQIPTLRAQALEEYNNDLNRLRNNLSMYQGQDNTDYSRYLDMLNAEYQRDRDAVADAQQEFNNAMAIYEATGKITGPLKDLFGKAAASSGGGGGGGGGGYYGGGGGSTTSSTGTWDPKTQATATAVNAVKSALAGATAKVSSTPTSSSTAKASSSSKVSAPASTSAGKVSAGKTSVAANIKALGAR